MITNRAKNNSSLLFIYFFLLAFLLAAPFSALAAEEFDPKTEKTLIEIFKENPNAIPLEPRDPTRDVRAFRRDPNDNPKREPGPINIQKTVGGTWFMGIPTFFRLPVALGPEDLKAGKVEVAFFGAAQDMSTGQRGTAFGPQAVRTGEIVGAWGQGIPSGHPVVGDVNWMQELVAVDYGDAPIDILSGERSVLPVYEMAKEIAETGAIPVTVGGDHSLMYPDIAAASAVYGAENLAVIHFDAHYDGIPLMFGHYLSHGAMVRRLIDEGHVMERTLTYYAIGKQKPAFGVEASKAFQTHKRAYYHLQVLEAYMDLLGIEYERAFNLSALGVKNVINSNVKLAFYDNRLFLDMSNARQRLAYVPLKKASEVVFKPSNPLIAVVASGQGYRVFHGNRRISRIYPQYFEYDFSIDTIDMQIDGEQKNVDFGEKVEVKESFMVMPTDGYRVNVIGFKKPGFANESGLDIRQNDILKRFSVDKSGQLFRVEVYKGKKFSGMVLVSFLDERQDLIASNPPKVSQINDSDSIRALRTRDSSTESATGFYLGR